MSTEPQTYLRSFDYFMTLFSKSRQNKVLMMNTDGIIMVVNQAFTTAFGYTQDDIAGSHIKILFTEEARALGLPERELSNVLSKGQCDDNNYLVNKTVK